MQEVEEVEEPLGRRNLRAHSVAKEGLEPRHTRTTSRK
jgi:hypothetical protein